MSLTDPDSKRLAEIKVHYHQALSLTKGLLSEIRAHGEKIDLEYLNQRLEKRKQALEKAALSTKGVSRNNSKDKGLEPWCQAIRKIAHETHELGEELVCLITRIKEDSKDELGGYESGTKLMKGYKGFKAKVALRFDRQA